MIVGLILFCAASIEPAQCGIESAQDYSRVPQVFAHPMSCFMGTIEWAAEHHLKARDDQRMVIVCHKVPGAPV